MLPHIFRSAGRAAFLCKAVVGIIGIAASVGAETGAPSSQFLVTAVHVHSTWSTGSLTIDQLAERARRLGIDAIVLSDNFALRYEYGLPPLRGLLRTAVTIPSLSPGTIGDYLAEVEAVQARYPDIVLVPGVEVAPHYYWTGSLFQGNLTMHNSQRNLLVFGMDSEEDYAGLPASGNTRSFRFHWSSILNFMPLLLLVPAGRYWMRRSKSRRRRRRYKVLGGVLATAALLMTVNAWPLGSPPFSTYSDQLGYAPYQALIDYVNQRNGIVVWSLPEARDFNTHSFGPLGMVTVKTDPHPEALLSTRRYTGFGGLYQDTRRIHTPGDMWDQSLGRYLAGDRTTAPVLFGEIAFHVPGQAGIELHQVVNIVRLTRRSRPELINALRDGKFYTVGQYHAGGYLRLDRFEVTCLERTCSAEVGDTLQSPPGEPLAIPVTVTATDDQSHPVTLFLIRSGKVLKEISGSTPLTHVFQVKNENSWSPSYYRVEVNGPGEILSNPVFVNTPRAESLPMP